MGFVFLLSIAVYTSYRLVHFEPGIYLNNVFKILLLLIPNKKHSVSIMKDRPGDAGSEIIAVWYANHTKSVDAL